MTLLEKLGAKTGEFTLPSAKTEGWKYTNLRALDAAAATLIQGQFSLESSNSVLLAENPRASIVAPSLEAAEHAPIRGPFALLAARAPMFSATLEAQNYYVFAPSAARVVVQQAQTLRVAEGQTAFLLWHHDGKNESSCVNMLTQILVGKDASLKVVRVQNCATTASLLERTEVRLEAGARLQFSDLNFGAQLSRHELQIDLAGVGAQAEVHVLSATKARQHIDTQLELRHLQINTQSSTRVKSVANERSRVVFNGRIFVAPGADGTDAQLKTNNLLLSEMAEIDAKPELEIHAEDVSCSHGATVGQLDEQALFYLRSRGIDAPRAKQILTVAFCQELLDRVGDVALVEKLSVMLHANLPDLSSTL